MHTHTHYWQYNSHDSSSNPAPCFFFSSLLLLSLTFFLFAYSRRDEEKSKTKRGNVMKSQSVSVERNNLPLVFILFFSTILAGIYQDGFAVLFPFLRETFDLNRVQLGMHSSFLFFTSTVSAVFTGKVVDHFGAKTSVCMSMILIGVFVLLHSLAPTYFTILILASLTGIGLTLVVPATIKGIVGWFPAHRRSSFIGLNLAGYSIGGFLAALILPYLAQSLGWARALIIQGLLYLILAVIIYYCMEETEDRDTGDREDTSTKPEKIDYRALFTDKRFLFLCLAGLIYASASSIITSHFTLFLFLDCGFDMAKAGFGFGVAQVGSVIGRPAWGIIADRLFYGDKKKSYLFIGLIFTSVVTLYGLFFRTMNVSILFSLAFLLGFTGRGWQGIYYSSVADVAQKAFIGTTIGLSLVFVRMGLMLGPPIFGYFADLRGFYDYGWLVIGFIVLVVSILLYQTMDREDKTLTEKIRDKR